MNKLKEAYNEKDRSRLHIGWAALDEINIRLEEDKRAGLTSPLRVALSAILEQLSEEYQKFHSSKESCRSYIRDSVRMARYFSPDLVEELAPYKLTTSHLIACIIRGESWPEADLSATGLLLDWTIANKATPESIWDHRKSTEHELSAESKAAKRLVKAVEHYMDVTAPENGFVERRKICHELIKIFEEAE
jgi:hypothetical protein